MFADSHSLGHGKWTWQAEVKSNTMRGIQAIRITVQKHGVNTTHIVNLIV